MVTRDGLSAESLVFLNFEFQKPANVGAQAMPLRTPKPEGVGRGIMRPLPPGEGAGILGTG